MIHTKRIKNKTKERSKKQKNIERLIQRFVSARICNKKYKLRLIC